jgi:serine/threonine-protein kinase
MRICPKCKTTYEEQRRCPEDDFRTVELESAEADEVDPRIGTVFEDRYRVEERLGEGGFGVVYLGTHLRIDRRIAIKVLDPHRAGDLEHEARFQREARLLGSLSHPNIVDVYDFGETESGEFFIVMEYLEGESLADRLDREGPLDPALAHRWACDVLSALAAAHDEDIVHRDLKPDNVFLTPVEGRADTVHLLDFGISKIVAEGETGASLTQTGLTLGSPHYMSPEQAQELDVGPASDLYSFGCTFYEALTGDKLFADKSKRVSLMLAICKEAPTPPTLEGDELRGPFVDALMACLAKEADDRPESAESLHATLSDLDPPFVEVVDTPPESWNQPDDAPSAEAPTIVDDTNGEPTRLDASARARAESDETRQLDPDDTEAHPTFYRRVSGAVAGLLVVGFSIGAAVSLSPFAGSETRSSSSRGADAGGEATAASARESDTPDAHAVDAVSTDANSSPVRRDTVDRVDAAPRSDDAAPSDALSTSEDVRTDAPPSPEGDEPSAARDNTPSVEPPTPSSTSDDPSSADSRGTSKVLETVRTEFTMGRREQARRRCRRAVEAGEPACLRLLGALHQTLGQRPEACDRYRSYLAHDPPDASRIESTLSDLGCPSDR